jgi:hypothetical protein
LESNGVRNPATTSAATTKQQIKKQKLLLLLTGKQHDLKIDLIMLYKYYVDINL